MVSCINNFNRNYPSAMRGTTALVGAIALAAIIIGTLHLSRGNHSSINLSQTASISTIVGGTAALLLIGLIKIIAIKDQPIQSASGKDGNIPVHEVEPVSDEVRGGVHEDATICDQSGRQIGWEAANGDRYQIERVEKRVSPFTQQILFSCPFIFTRADGEVQYGAKTFDSPTEQDARDACLRFFKERIEQLAG